MIKKIGVLGAGSWGSTLAAVLAWKRNDVTLWEYDQKQAQELSSRRTLKFFPQLIIPKQVQITNDLKDAVQNMDFVVFAVPSHTLRSVAGKASAFVRQDAAIFISATKGIETQSLNRMSEVISQEITSSSGKIVVFSGPTHAEEVSNKIPTAATAASKNISSAKEVQKLFGSTFFRIYTSTDIIGVETGAALKNIFAIAAGICDGLGLGDNTKAALVTRGMRELAALGIMMGGNPSTFFGLTGLGDLIVTCFSSHSRNRALGERIGSGKSLAQSEKEIMMVAEGVRTTKAAHELGKKFGLNIPIIDQVYEIIYNDRDPMQALTDLMMRQPKEESELEISRLVL